MNEWLVGALIIIPLTLAATAIVRMNRPLSAAVCRKCGNTLGDTGEAPGLVPFRAEPLRALVRYAFRSTESASDCPNCGAR